METNSDEEPRIAQIRHSTFGFRQARREGGSFPSIRVIRAIRGSLHPSYSSRDSGIRVQQLARRGGVVFRSPKKLKNNY
jgi:hypothetical protein